MFGGASRSIVYPPGTILYPLNIGREQPVTAAVVTGVAGILQLGLGGLLGLSGTACVSSGPGPAVGCGAEVLIGTLFLAIGAFAIAGALVLYTRPSLHVLFGALILSTGAVALAAWLGLLLNPQLLYGIAFPPFTPVMQVAGGILALLWRAEPTRWMVLEPQGPPPVPFPSASQPPSR
jgi:hypothetical protein